MMDLKNISESHITRGETSIFGGGSQPCTPFAFERGEGHNLDCWSDHPPAGDSIKLWVAISMGCFYFWALTTMIFHLAGLIFHLSS